MSQSKSFVRRHTLLVALALVLAVWTLAPASEAVAQETQETQDATNEQFIELLRQDIQADKIALMTAALQLTNEQGEKFWPVYRDYQVELSAIGDSRIKLIKDYAANYETMTEDKAAELSKTSFGLQEKRVSLLKKTHKKVSKEIGPILATRFAQVENQLLMLIDMQIASEMPLIK